MMQKHCFSSLGQSSFKTGRGKVETVLWTDKSKSEINNGKRHMLLTKEERAHPACYRHSVCISNDMGGASVESAGSISEKATSILKSNTTFRAHMVSCFREGLPNFSKTMLNCAQDLLQKHGSVVEAKLVYLCSRPLSNWKHESEKYNKGVGQEVKNENILLTKSRNWSPQFPHVVLSQLSLDVLHQTILQKLFSGHYFLVPLRRI